jgi:transposase
MTHHERVVTGPAAARPLEGVTDGGELHHYSPYVGASSQAAPAARSREQRRLWKVRGDREM